MLQRAASNAYSWWWASHIRTKQSKWLEQNLIDMEEKVHNTLKLIEEDGDSFAKRAEMYYKKRPELINFVEESYRAYRSLAERYDHISTELQNANNTIATIFPEQVQFAMDEEDEYASPRFPKKFPVVPKTDIPKVPKGPIKDLRSVITTATATKKFQSKKTAKAATSKSTAPISGLSKPRALEHIDRFQKQILSLQTEKEFMKSSYENGLAKYWEIEKQIKELQEKVCKLQDEFGEGMVIEDDEARSLMATAALKSCQETLAQLQEKQEKSTEEAKIEYQRIKAVWEKLVSLKDKYHSNQIDEENRNGNNESGKAVKDLKPFEPEVGIPTEERQKLELIRKKIKEHFEAGSNFTVTEMAEKIDELVNKVISLESAVSSQTALVKRLRNETDELQAQLQTLEDDKATLLDGKNTLINKVKDMEEKLQGVQDLNQSFSEQNSNLQTHFTEANCNLDHLSEKLQTVKLDEELEVKGSSEIFEGSLCEDKLPKQFEEQEDVLNPLEGFKTMQGKKSGEELKVTAPLQKEQGSPGKLRLFEALEKQEAASEKGDGSSPSEVISVDLKEREAAPSMGNGSSPAEVVTLQGLKEQEAAPNLGKISSLSEARSLQESKEQEAASNLENVSSSVVARSLEELKEHEAAPNLGNVTSPGVVRSLEELKEHEAAPNLGNFSSPAVAISLEELKEQETAPNMGKGSSPAVARSLEELEEHEAAPNTGNVSSPAVMRSEEELKQQETAPNMGNDSFPVYVRSLEELKQQEAAPNTGNASFPVEVRSLQELKAQEAAPNMGNASSPDELKSLQELKAKEAAPNTGNASSPDEVRSLEELKVQEAAPDMGNGSSPAEVRSVEQLKEQEGSSNMGEGSGNVRETLSISAGDQEEKNYQPGENNKPDNELPNSSNMQTLSQTVDNSPHVEPQEQETEKENELDWQKMFLNGIENREKILLTEYTTTLRNYKDVKKQLNEVEKKTQDSLFETSVQLKNLKSANAKKDEEIRSLRLKLSLLQQSLEEDIDFKYFKASEMENPTTPTDEKEDIDAMLIDQSSTNMSEIEEKFRMDIDALLEENLDFWLKFSTSFHQIQKFETEVKDLQSEVLKLEDKRKNQDGSSTLKHLLKSDARPLYKHLREIQTELTVWLEKSVLLKDEMQCRFTSLCNIQEEITQALKTSAEDDDFKFTSYQAAKFQGEVLNMKQENNKVADELQAALDHVTTLQLDVDKTLAKLNEEFALSGSRKQQEPQLSHSESRSRVPLRSFIFGVKPKKQRSIFSCVTPAMHRKYHGLRAGPPL